MINTLKSITQNYKVACGWNFLIHYVQEIGNDFEIIGYIFDGYNNKMDIIWDSNGYPKAMNEHPTYYYMRLIAR